MPTMQNDIEKKEYIPGLISVIVPVYNSKDYLFRCIESIVNQTYTNLEILIIDDGSTDGSGQICGAFQTMDDRVSVFYQKNRGAAAARNLGLEKARGEFIGFVDSDDYIKKDMYTSLHDVMKEDVDMVCCGSVLLFPKRMHRKCEIYGKALMPMTYTKCEALRELLLVRNLDFSLCNKLYRRELFQDVRLPDGKTCEDFPVVYKVVKNSQKIVCTGEVKYYYCYRENSMSKQQFTIRRMSYVVFARDIFGDVNTNYPDIRKCAEAFYIRSVVDTMRDIEKCVERDRYEFIHKRLRKLLLRMHVRIFLNQYIPEKTKKTVLKLILRGET